MTEKASPFKLGNETNGTLKIEEVFLQTLEVYFIRLQD